MAKSIPDPTPYLRELKTEYERRSFAELNDLPKQLEIDSPEHLTPFTFMVWRHNTSSGDVRIIVEAYHSRWWGIVSNSWSDGFEKSPGGGVRELPPDAYY